MVMANERKTENLVRNELRKLGYYKNENIVVEEQKSDNLKIDKLLKHASKNGLGKGRPEFIIQNKNHPDFIIVIECKSDPKKHESRNRDKPANYAVDGALLYASFLSKEYDVLAIAVSGEKKSELRISHFIQLKNKSEKKDFSHNILTFKNYYDEYIKSPIKFNQDYSSLLKYSGILNDKLHHFKIKESERSLLISVILISLKNKAFKASYHHNLAKDLASNLVSTATSQMRVAGLDAEKLKILEMSFSFISTHPSLSKEEGVLVNLIKEVDKEINTFMNTYRYRDTLGKFYIQFLRYANNDKGLGIVLTPIHITELFSDLAQVNKNSSVIDTCAGTGGFLISAMKKMIEDAKKDDRKIEQIKKNQILGIEYQDTIFSLACCNMFIHDDGKSKLIEGDCFSNDILKSLSGKKFDYGFLNPPYKVTKKDKEELEFVLNNLKFLKTRGLCIAIVPMSCALSTTGKGFNLKEQLLRNNTLEAVLSMPDDLFSDTDVGIRTCIMIFSAGVPHNDKQSFFGFFKEDGFIKKRNGRIDENQSWERIKAKWLSAYFNKQNLNGFSINKKVTSRDEWCPEAYLRTDFKKIRKENFIFNLKKYCIYKFENGLLDQITSKSKATKQLHINFEKWGNYRVHDLFEIKSGGDKPKNTSSGELINSIENQVTNNGVKEKIRFSKEDKIFKNFISVVSIGEGGKAFYQSEKSSCFTRVKALIPKNKYKTKISPYIFMFFCTILDMERYRYGYGRVLSINRLGETVLLLPQGDIEPDWQFMEDYIKSLPYSANL